GDDRVPDPAALTAAIAGLTGSGIGYGLQALVSRRKLRGDAARAVTEAAEQVVGLQVDAIRRLQDGQQRLERQLAADREAQAKHTAWDRIARQRLKDAGIDVP